MMHIRAIDEARGEGVRPVIYGTGINAHSSFREQFDHVGIIQALAKISAQVERNDVVGKAVAAES